VTERWQAGEEPEEEQTGGRGWFWLALLVLMAVCAVALYRSALFRLEQVTVTGLKNVPEARVLAAAGLVPGAARWDHPAARVRQRLLQEPWIKTAEVTWEWNRVLIHVTEREPVGLLQYTDRFYLLLDESGTILGQAELHGVKGLPAVSGKQVSTALRGEALTDPGLLDALSVLAWNAPALRGQISEIAVREDRVLTLYMASGATVKWGKVPIGKERDGALKEKTEYFGGLWNGLRKRSAGCEVDLSVDDKYFASGCD
jgi:cell division septal protein FtsQ